MIQKSELIRQELLSRLEKEKLYLDPTLSLSKMSLLVGTNNTYLSVVINEGFGCNFNTLINKYRIECSKQQLEELKENNEDASTLAKRCGFSSTSAYYNAFKKITGISPKQYKAFAMLTKANKTQTRHVSA